jgi:hypothetical protein
MNMLEKDDKYIFLVGVRTNLYLIMRWRIEGQIHITRGINKDVIF